MFYELFHTTSADRLDLHATLSVKTQNFKINFSLPRAGTGAAPAPLLNISCIFSVKRESLLLWRGNKRPEELINATKHTGTCCGEEEEERAGSLWAPHHALFTLDHEPLVLVEAADAADDVLILLVPIVLVAHRGLAAVGLAGRLPHDLVDLRRRLVPGVVVSLAQPAHVPPRRGLPAVVFLQKSNKKNPKSALFPCPDPFSSMSS